MPHEALIVSDDARVREDVVDGFGPDWTVHLSADARDAQEQMRTFTPEIVVVDMRTGNAGGYALTRDMAQDGRLDGVPVMILLERPQDAWLAKSAGATLIRTKPITAEQLLRDARSLLPAEAS